MFYMSAGEGGASATRRLVAPFTHSRVEVGSDIDGFHYRFTEDPEGA